MSNFIGLKCLFFTPKMECNTKKLYFSNSFFPLSSLSFQCRPLPGSTNVFSHVLFMLIKFKQYCSAVQSNLLIKFSRCVTLHRIIGLISFQFDPFNSMKKNARGKFIKNFRKCSYVFFVILMKNPCCGMCCMTAICLKCRGDIM